MDYKDNEVRKSLEKIRDYTQNKKIDWVKIKLVLNNLWYLAFKEGVYVGK